jgi:small subunit ribosomal protein S11
MAKKKVKEKAKGAEGKARVGKKVEEEPASKAAVTTVTEAPKQLGKEEPKQLAKEEPKQLAKEEPKQLGKEEPVEVREAPKKHDSSEFVAVCHVYSSKNNTIVTVTDLSGAETLSAGSGGMVVKSGREERTPFAGGQIARRVAGVIKDKGVTKVDILLRGKGGHGGQKSPGRAASAIIKVLARSGIKIRRIEDVTPIPHGGSKPPGGKRGRRV